MQATQPIQHLDAQTAKEFLDKLPEHIRQTFLDRAAAINYPVEAVLESTCSSRYPQWVASSLDPDALSFVDCKPQL
jgi:hypothetical protein